MTDPLQLFTEEHSANFLRAYERCITPGLGLGVPALVCAALSAELGLKILLRRNGVELKKEHRLKELFELAPAEDKGAISADVCKRFADWEEQLAQASNAFVEWRYIYESQGPKEVNTHFVGQFASAIQSRIRAIQGAA